MFLNLIIKKNAHLNFSTESRIIALSPPVDDSYVDQELPIDIEYLSTGEGKLRKPYTFQYKGNPKVGDINPKQGIGR